MSEAFSDSFSDAHFHANSAVACITLHFFKETALEDGEASMKGEDMVDTAGDPQVIEL